MQCNANAMHAKNINKKLIGYIYISYPFYMKTASITRLTLNKVAIKQNLNRILGYLRPTDAENPYRWAKQGTVCSLNINEEILTLNLLNACAKDDKVSPEH